MEKLHALITINGIEYIIDGHSDPHSADLDRAPGTLMLDLVCSTETARELKQCVPEAIKNYSRNYALMMFDSYVHSGALNIVGILTGDEELDQFTQKTCREQFGREIQIPNYQRN